MENDRTNEKLIKIFISAKKAEENRKFGEFIVQSNRIQFYLSTLLLFRSSFADKKYIEYIENTLFSNLIHLFCACAKKETGEALLIPRLRKYNDERNRLAHKMYTTKKLTKEECQKAIKGGEQILKGFDFLIKKEVERVKNKK